MIQPHTGNFQGPGAWHGESLSDADREQTIYHLSTTEIEEIDHALQHVKDQNLAIPFARSDFPLKTFENFLNSIPERLEDGHGFVLIRGLPRDRYSLEECELIYWGLGVHLGNPVSQNSRGHLMGHVRDEGKAADDPNARLYQTTAKMDFHCDQLPVDVLGLFCVRTAKSGGESALVSVPAVHNIIRKERPDLLEALYQIYNIDWRDDQPDGMQPWYEMPMLSYHDGKLTARVTSRAYCETASRFGDHLAMSDAQREAVDFMQEVANRPGIRLHQRFEDGDIQFINNHMLMHGRTDFEDYDEPERKRHLLRMWIAYPPQIRRQFAPELAERVKIVDGGGIPLKQKMAS